MSYSTRDRDRPRVPVLSVLALIVSAIAIVFPAPAHQWLDDRTGFFFPNTKNTPLAGLLVSTSSSREDLHGDMWSGDNLLDHDVKSAWSECALVSPRVGQPERRSNCAEPRFSGLSQSALCANPSKYASDPTVQGIGQYVEFTILGGADLKAIVIRNGIQKSDQLYLRNPRVRALRVSVDGHDLGQLNLKDDRGPQFFDLFIHATHVRLTIVGTYLGQCITGPKGEQLGYYYDTSLSDVDLVPSRVTAG